MNIATKTPIFSGKRTILSPIDISVLGLVPLSMIVYNLYYHPFSSFPGVPLSSTWSGWLAWQNDCDPEDLGPLLHEHYGPIIRISTNIISVDDPEYVKEISIQANPPEWWLPFAHKGVDDVFFVPPPGLRAELGKWTVEPCSVGMVRLWEGVVDYRIREWIGRLRAENGNGEVRFDFFEWARHLSVGLVGRVVFGVDMGCARNGEDNEGRSRAFESELGGVGVLAKLRTIWKGLVWGSVPNVSAARADREDLEAMRVKAGVIVDAAWEAREKEEARREGLHPNIKYEAQAVTILEKTMSAKNSEGTRFTKEEVHAKCFPPFLAGQDSTAFALTNTLKLLFGNPRVLAALLSELETYSWLKPPSQIPSWAEIEEPGTKLPYLSAVLHESLRFNPAFLMSVPRIATSSGVELNNNNGLYTLPGGLQISLNPIVICRNKRIFGEDVHSFRPERWLEGTREEIERMKAVGLGWGAGSSDCFGKDLAQMIVAKVIAVVLVNYKLVDRYSRGDEWEFVTTGACRATELWVRMKSRAWDTAGPSERL